MLMCFSSSFVFYDLIFLLQPLFPRVLGHEGVGMVESIGEGVTQLKEGDIVVPTYLGECGECENCRSGKTNLCQTYPLQAFTGLLTDGTSRMSINGGQKLYHFLSCSTWSEYTVVDANYVVKIDSRISLPHASFISCGFATGFGAAWKEAKLQKGSTVAVLGLGAVGLGVIEGARVQGAARIIGIDINEKKREKGEAFGMTDFVNPRRNSEKSISELVKGLTGGIGVDYCFECSGVATLVTEVLESTKVGIGTAILLGAGTQKSIEIDFLPLLSARTLKYSVFGGIKIQSDLPIIVEKCINKEIEKLDELLTDEVQLEDINRAFELMKKPDCVKVLIKF
uniref:Putative alcohol dehydrogenase 2 n=1 Tax=Davidia involucrata TaxID=16924 RepID=A0A5B7BYK4_DAVIN